MYEIEYTPQAIEDLKYFKKHEQQQILGEIPVQLRYEPSVETRNRKRTRPIVWRHGNCGLRSFESFTMLKNRYRL
jgi:mRNA-degrading endonuclease RelE of RelBE toxin-antitoxin system